jgi:hypothetical protein
VVNVNGAEDRSKGYYDMVYDLHFTDSGKYAYKYRENWKWYVLVNVNGTEDRSRGYDDISYDHFHLTESGKYTYKYQENGKWYVVVNVNGTENRSGGYDDMAYLRFTESGKYAYKYQENGKWYVVVNVNGTENRSEGYDAVDDLKMDANGNYDYHYSRDGKSVATHNGKSVANPNGKETEYAHFAFFGSAADRLEIYSADGKHSFHSSYEYKYIVIDGKRYGASSALDAWYDKDKNAFIWNVVEGKKLVVYDYKLNE